MVLVRLHLALVTGLTLSHHVLPTASSSRVGASGGRGRRRERPSSAGSDHLVVTLSGTAAPDGAGLEARRIALHDEPNSRTTPFMFVPAGAVLRFPQVGATQNLDLVPRTARTAYNMLCTTDGMAWHGLPHARTYVRTGGDRVPPSLPASQPLFFACGG